MKRYILFVNLLSWFYCIAGSSVDYNIPESLIDFVEPRIGTSHSETRTAGLFGKGTEELGQTLPAVFFPNGMNFWTPQTRDTELKCIAPYYYTDSLFQGFRNSHWIVGGCTQDYGSMTLTAISKTLRTSPEIRATKMDKETEISRPDYYAVFLPEEGIKAEMTSTSRAALFQFTFDGVDEGYLVVNPNNDEEEGFIEIDLKNNRIVGYNPVRRIYQGWGESAGFSGWFVVEWEKDTEITDYGVYQGSNIYEKAEKIEKQNDIGAYIAFPVHSSKKVMVKAASSFTGLDGAINNLNKEIPSFDFERVRADLSKEWEERLGKILVYGAQKEELVNFYSALYRSSFLPRTFNDIDGSYPAFSKGNPIYKMEAGKTYYEDFSMWDTYRALHPLLNIISPSQNGEMMNSLVLKYEQGGWLPIFPCWNSYTAAMIGDHAISVIADAYIKDTQGFNIEKAYEAMRKNAFESPVDMKEYEDGMGRRALKSYLKYGYVPYEDSVPNAFHTKEQVSRTLEYAYDDYALAQVAKKLGKNEDYELLIKRAENWKNVINPQTGYAAPKDSMGNFIEIDPFSFSKHITEGAPCHYTWYVPHDQEGLIEHIGGTKKYFSKLDSMFTQHRYWHGNEPCHQVAWLFPFIGQPEKTVEYVKKIMETEYMPVPGGLSGNDDAGQMSAWYIFGALGFYPVCPSNPDYIIGESIFPKIVINLENGNTFTIINERKNEDLQSPRSILINNEPIKDYKLNHHDIMRGGTLTFK